MQLVATQVPLTNAVIAKVVALSHVHERTLYRVLLGLPARAASVTRIADAFATLARENRGGE
jgi:hypothetical protein